MSIINQTRFLEQLIIHAKEGSRDGTIPKEDCDVVIGRLIAMHGSIAPGDKNDIHVQTALKITQVILDTTKQWPV